MKAVPIVVTKKIVIENKTFRVAEIFLNLGMLVVLFVVGILTGLLLKSEYYPGTAIITPEKSSMMEGVLNKDLYRASTSEYTYTSPGNTILLAKEYYHLTKSEKNDQKNNILQRCKM